MSNFETAQDLFTALCEPFPAEYIDWRVGSATADKKKGMALAYIDARTVMDRLDSICGPDGWQCNYTPGVAGSIVCNLGIQMPSGEWRWKADGAGATDVEGERGMLSDALKRAAVRWGVGRYLYELGSPWVELDEGRNGKAGPIKKSERNKLDNLHEEYAAKAGWGIRAGRVAYSFANQVVKHFVTTPADAQDMLERNAGTIAQMPVAMQKHLKDTLARVGATAKEAAE